MNKSSFFIVGKHPVIEALKNSNRKVLRVFLTEESKKTIQRKSKRNLLKGVKVFLKQQKLDKYSAKENLMHQGYVAEIEHLDDIVLKEFIKEKELNIVCLDQVTDQKHWINHWISLFKIDGIIKDRHFPTESKLMYKSMWCMEHINIFKVSNINTTLKYLREKNFGFMVLIVMLNKTQI